MTHSPNAEDGTSPLRLAILGCGVIGTLHARVAANNPDLHVVCVVDPVRERAERIAQYLTGAGRPEPRIYGDLTEAMADEELDVVSVCTPSGTHAELAGQVLAGGAHVVIEKPLDASLTAARALHAQAQQYPGQVASVISQHRHDPSALAIRHAVQAGRLGRLTSAVVNVDWYRTQDYYDSGQWRGTWEGDGGGVLINQGVHSVDLLLWFLGEPVDVLAHTARLGHEGIEGEDVAVAILRFASGALATIHASTCVYPDLGVRIQVHGSDGAAVIEGDQLAFFHARDAEGETWQANQAHHEVPSSGAHVPGGFDPAGSHTSQYGDSHDLQWADVVQAIRTGRPPSVTLDDALLALATVRSVYLSATLGRSIAVADVLAGKYDDVAVRTGGVSESIRA